jgi:hypothetical protein
MDISWDESEEMPSSWPCRCVRTAAVETGDGAVKGAERYVPGLHGLALVIFAKNLYDLH